MLLATNSSYVKGTENITLQDLLDYLKKHNIEPSAVEIDSGFTTRVKVKKLKDIK